MRQIYDTGLSWTTMRLLWVKYGKILPVDTGGKLRSFNLLRHLSRQVHLTYFSYYEGARDIAYEDAIRQELPGAVCVDCPEIPVSRSDTVFAFVRAAFHASPFTTTRFTSIVARAEVERLLRSEAFDLALCDFLTPTLVLSASMGRSMSTPTVLFEHNVESDLWSRRFESERRWLVRPVYWWESRRMRRWETQMLSDYDHVLAVSRHDRERFTQLAPNVRIDVVPTGVDLQQFSPAAGSEPSPGLVVFVGSMDWEPNVDGVRWFCESVWPTIRERRPSSRFRIVGRSPGPLVRALAAPDIELTGSVSSVVEHLREAEVVVVPLRVGGGTRLKIYEAMATGAAVVSTTIGAEGLDVQDEEQILLRDDPKSIAESILGLLDTPDRRRRLAHAGREHALKHDWARVADDLRGVLAGVKLRSRLPRVF